MPKEGFCDHSPIGGATEEDLHCTADMGLTQADTTAITDGWRNMLQRAHTALVNAGGFSWDQFSSFTAPNATQCTAWFRNTCGSNNPYYSVAAQQSYTHNADGSFCPLPQFTNDFATFLLVRGPYAWIGYGWVGCSSGSEPPGGGGQCYQFPAELNADYGQPVDQYCAETAPGSAVFVRHWSKATVQMDCNSYTATITML
jgi:hypothetical protein